MIVLDLSILNQKGTPMFNSDLTANRPAAGIVGRIFIAIDAPYGIFRDTGSAWDQISGASTFSGSLATGQVAFGSATNTISGTNNLFWDNANARLGIGTNAPSTTFDLRGKARIESTSNCEFDFINGSNIVRLALSATAGFVGTLTNLPFSFFTASIERGRFSISGNLLLGNTIDAGEKLQVYGDTFLKGSGATSATNALLVQNSASTELVKIDNSGQAFYSNRIAVNRIQVTTTANQLELAGGGVSASGGDGIALGQFTNVSNTSGIHNRVISGGSFLPTSGTGVSNCFNVGATINQTGGANGITRGLYVNPTLTAAADWRSIEWSNNTGWGIYGAGTALNYLGGTLGIKTTSPYAPSTFSLDVNGGLLVKNTAGTTAQITLINADPSIGGNNGFLVASVGGTSGGSFVDFQGYYGASVIGSTALRLNPGGGPVIVNSTTNSGEQFQVTGTLRVNGQTSGSAGGNSGQHLIINCDGTSYKIALLNP